MTKILLVEDDKNLREIYGVRLMAEGYQIVSSGDGEEALAVAIKEHPDLIISDVMMPKISGFDMLDILRQTPETKDLKVIMMTALSSEDQRARGESLGADRYLVKSQVGIEDVVRTVHEVLGDVPSSAQPTVFPPVSTPAPTPQVAPETPAVASPAPVAVSMPSPQPVMAPAPVAPIPELAMAPMPATPEPPVINTPVPVVPTPIPVGAPVTLAPAPSPLPQPTAPFSSPAPASLGERVIAPVSAPETFVAPPLNDIAAQMQAELQALSTPPAPASGAPETPPQAQ